MKRLNIVVSFFIAIILFASCKKDSSPNKGIGTTSLNIVNTVNGSSDLLANFNNQLSYQDVGIFRTVPYGIYSFFINEFSFPGGNVHLSVRQVSDTLHSVYDNAGLNLPNNTAHSLFLTGTADNPESVLTTDTLPYHTTTDSVASIRFINLLVGSSPVNINLVGNASGSEANSLNYKAITGFKTYTATSNISDYNFEFRDAGTGTLITSYDLAGVNFYDPYTPNNVLFRDLTIVLFGTPDAPSVLAYYPGQY